jgi:hypothetical protein
VSHVFIFCDEKYWNDDEEEEAAEKCFRQIKVLVAFILRVSDVNHEEANKC